VTDSDTIHQPTDLLGAFRSLADMPRQKPLAMRTSASNYIREYLKAKHAEAENALLINGRGTGCAVFLSTAEDGIIRALFDFARLTVFNSGPLPLSIVAVGGYGRGTLAPGSDIDLLFLTPAIENPRVAEVVEFILYALWDARQKVGHATRTVADCVKLAKTDNTIMTAVLEARYICGDEALFSDLQTQYRSGILEKEARSFVSHKLAERDIRHVKSGESRYAVEPDIKDGKGGLRDLHTLFWIAKFLFNANSPEELAEKGAFPVATLSAFRKPKIFSGPCAVISILWRSVGKTSCLSIVKANWQNAWVTGPMGGSGMLNAS
jgi:[protein-PII] uridylyltransferase